MGDPGKDKAAKSLERGCTAGGTEAADGDKVEIAEKP